MTDNTTLPSISSQLYGASQSQSSSANVGGLATSTNPLSSSQLHQVPIHIYPGLETAPLNSPTPAYQQPHIPPPQHSQPPPDFSVHLSPIHDLTSTDPFATNAMNTPSKPPSLSTMLDLSALEATRVPSLHSEESGQDEQIDFDALWVRT